MISMIAAAGEDNALGRKGKLLWHLPQDMKRFRRITMGHPVILGRKTFETLPCPLPGRTNIIVTRQSDYKTDGCIVVNSFEKALEKAKSADGNEKICIVGGGEIYKLGLAHANHLELTRVHHKFEGGDAFFPEFDTKNWELAQEIYHAPDNRHKYSFSYQTFVKK